MRVPGHDWLYAIGDVNGRALFTHMGKYQARLAADHLLGHDHVLLHGADGPLSPRVIFTEPQVAAVGHTTRDRGAGGPARRRRSRRRHVRQRGRLVLRPQRAGHDPLARRPRAQDRRRLHDHGRRDRRLPARGDDRDRGRGAAVSGCGTRSRLPDPHRDLAQARRVERRRREPLQIPPRRTFGTMPIELASRRSGHAHRHRPRLRRPPSRALRSRHAPSRRSGASSCSPASSDGILHRVTAGAFVRQQSQFRGRPEGGPERHHLYVALACPWSQRAAIVRAVLGLRTARHLLRRPVPRRARLGLHRRALHGRAQRLRVPRAGLRRDRSRLRRPRLASPCCGTRTSGRIVSNESADIVAHLRRVGRRRPLPGRTSAPRSTSSTSGSTASSRTASTAPASPAPRRPTTRPSAACSPRWTGSRRSWRERRYLAGDEITLADWRLLPTLLRFDAVYHTHFRCNGRRLIEYPHLLALHDATSTTQPHVAETFALDEIKRHYYTTHDELNPKRIIPPGRSTSASPSAGS